MKIERFVFIVTFLFISGCSPHFHIDFLGKSKIEEVTLVESKANEKIVIIDISGIISSTISSNPLGKEKDLLSSVYERLQKAALDKSVKGIILKIDSPGGEVTSSDILFHEVLKFKEKTGVPVIAMAMGLAASGGYYVASACDYIIAHPSTITGSIGVISIFPNVEELFSKIGIKMNVIKSGKMKDSGSSFRKMNKEDEKLYQNIIDEFYNNFLDAIMVSRNKYLSRDDLMNLADGRVYTAKQALKLKLIDEIGYMDSALKKIKSLAQITSSKVVVYSYFPSSKTNIYSLVEEYPVRRNQKEWGKILPSLKSGFYYLWLPQTVSF